MSRLSRASRSFLVRLLVTCALVGAIALQIDWRRASDRLSDGNWTWFAFAVGLLLCSIVLGAARWHLLLRGAGIDASRRGVLRAYAIGLFSNNFLPTSFGGDVARAWIVARTGSRLVPALTSVLVDRLTSFFCLVVVSWGALAMNSASVPGSLILSLLCVTLGGAAVGSFVMLLALHGGGGLAGRLPIRLRNWAREIRETLWLYVKRAPLLGGATLLGIVFQVFGVTAVWALARAIGLDLSYSLVAVAAPLILVITLVPISIAGFGVREGGAVLVFGTAGVSTTDAVVFSLVGVFALLISTLPGALALLSGVSSQTPPSASEAAALSGPQ